MAIYEQDKVFYSDEANGDKTIHLPITRANNVEGLGRSANTTYSVGDVVYADTNKAVALKCTTAGTTSDSELDISTNVVGDSVADGGVVWSVLARDTLNALPLSGGAITNSIVGGFDEVLPVLKRKGNNRKLSIWGAEQYNDGATLSLKGINDNEIAGEEGGFFISATDGVTKHWLVGLKDGKLLWKGELLPTFKAIDYPTLQQSVTIFSNGFTIICGNGNTVASPSAIVGFAVPFVYVPTVIVNPKQGQSKSTYYASAYGTTTTGFTFAGSVEGYDLYFNFIVIGWTAV